MKPGAFSLSLNVKDIAVSRAFYEQLGFAVFAGQQEQNWLIMKNGTTIIGLFQGMLGSNTLTFNPGWDADAQPVDPFDDVRTIQQQLLAAGIPLSRQADPNGTGPDYITLTDPDGNQILIDQHR